MLLERLQSKVFSDLAALLHRTTIMDEKHANARSGLAPAQKAKLTSLVSYQAGSVVSRTVINEKAGTVTIFAFDEGDGLSEHTAPFDALLHVLEGEAEIIIAGNKNHLEHGEAIVLPAGKPHAVRALTRFKMLLTMIRSSRTPSHAVQARASPNPTGVSSKVSGFEH